MYLSGLAGDTNPLSFSAGKLLQTSTPALSQHYPLDVGRVLPLKTVLRSMQSSPSRCVRREILPTVIRPWHRELAVDPEGRVGGVRSRRTGKGRNGSKQKVSLDWFASGRSFETAQQAETPNESEMRV